MKLTLCQKLILAIGLPLLAVYLVVLISDYRQLRNFALERMENQLMQQASAYAARFEHQFQSIAQIGRATAAFLNSNDQFKNDEEIFAVLEAAIKMDPLVYGACVAFEPDALGDGRERFAPYMYRDGGTLLRMDIGRDAYDYTQWEWYQRPLLTQRSLWTEPYIDEGASDVMMCTYATPLMRNDKVIGVATVDVALTDLQSMVNPSDFVGQVFAIVSRSGKFISHPNPDFIMKESLLTVTPVNETNVMSDMAAMMSMGQIGLQRVTDFPTPGRNLVLFAPVRSTGWSFVTAAPEAQALEPVYAELSRRPVIMLLALLSILGIVYVASTRITEPLHRLAEGVAKIRSGDLTAQIPAIRSRDELGELSNAFNGMVTNLKQQMEALEQETAKREKIESELEVARSIQASLLPLSLPLSDAFHLSAVNIPARQVAGDFYDFFFTRDNLLTVVVADVSGKGVPAALFMAVTRTVLRNLARSGCSPGEILQQANETIVRDNRQGLFVTVWVGQYDIRTGKLRYANCGHPPPYRLDAQGNVDTFGDVTAPLLGVIDTDLFGKVEENELQLNTGDTMLLYTDGIPEAISPEGEFFCANRFQRLLTDLAFVPVDQLCELTIKSVDKFQGDLSADDRTLVALHRYK